MKIVVLSALILTLLFAGTTVTSAQTPPPRFAYIANRDSGNVSGYAIDPNTGALTPVPGSPFPADVCPVSVIVDPTGRFAYVPNICIAYFISGSISAYTIDASSGSLTPIPGSPFSILTGTGANSATIDPTGKFLYATLFANGFFGAVAGFTIDANSGALTPVPGSPFSVGPSVSPITLAPNGKFAYMQAYAGNNPSTFGFAIDSPTGSLSPVPGSPFPGGASLFPITVDPTGKFAYVPDPTAGTGGVSVFNIDPTTGALTQVSGSPFPAVIPISVTLDPTGKFAYVVDNSCGNPPDGTVTGFTVDSSSGALTQIGSPFPAGNCPQSMTMHPTGKFLYVVDNPNSVLGYAIDGTTGLLSTVPGSPFQTGSGLIPLTVDSSGRFAYITSGTTGVLSGTSGVSAFVIDPITGTLTPVSGSPFPTGTNPQSVTLTPGPGPIGTTGPPVIVTPIAPGLGSTTSTASSSPTSAQDNLGTQATTSEPISTGNGNYVYAHTDFVVPGRGMPLVFSRSYNSLDNYSGPLGTNWTHSYNIALFQNLTGDITVKWGDGHGETFTLSGVNYVPQAGVFNTLVKNADGTFVLTRKDQTQFAFSAGGTLTSIRDKNANVVSLTYNATGNLAQVTDTVGRNLNFSYDGSNRIVQMTDPISRAVTFQYDSSNNLAQATDAAGGVTTFAYDGGHRVTSITQPNGQILLRNTYDSSGRVISQAGGRGFSTTLSYGTPNPADTTITDARGNQTIDKYDSSLRIVKITDATGGMTSFTYDTNNDRTSVTNQNGKTTSFAYDVQGNITGIVDPLANATAFTYDVKNDLLSATNAKGKITSFTYNANGNLTRIQDALAHTTTLTYDSFGELVSKTDARGNATNFLYDSFGNLTRITNALGSSTNLSYDGIGRLNSITDPNGHVASATYDVLSRLVKITDPLSNQTQFAYDSIGNLLNITDAKGNATSYAYDATNDLTSVTDALGHITRYAYDANNNRITFSNAKSNATTYAYDALNRLNRITDPLSFATSYLYDSVGNVLAVTDAKGQTNQFAYDALNRLLTVAYADGKSVAYSYDANGNRINMVDSHGTTAYSYDDLDRLTSITHPGGKVVTYAHDAVGNLKSLTYPDTKVVSYSFDQANRLSAATDWLGRNTAYSYDAAGNLTRTSYPNGTSMAFGYDAANRLSNVTNALKGIPALTLAYALDAVGNRVALSLDGVTTNFSYDALNELLSAQLGPLKSTWTYDAVGNRSKQTAPLVGAITYTYDAGDRLIAAGTATFTYDANGNQTSVAKTSSSQALTYQYDAANRLIGATGGKTNSAFTYDGDGNRISQSVGAGTYNYLNDVATALPVVLQESGPDGNISYAYGLGLISESGPKFDYFYHYDGLGSAIALSNASGKPSAAYAYDAWGNPLLNVSDSVGTKNKFRFTGEALDPGTGLYYLRARYYDASVGRFVSRDPIGGSSSWPLSRNRYQYALANPTRYTDPLGLSSLETSNAPSQQASILSACGTNCQMIVGTIAKAVSSALQVINQVFAEGLNATVSTGAAAPAGVILDTTSDLVINPDLVTGSVNTIIQQYPQIASEAGYLAGSNPNGYSKAELNMAAGRVCQTYALDLCKLRGTDYVAGLITKTAQEKYGVAQR